MTYLRPPRFVRQVFNPVAMRLGLSGVNTLAVPARRSGRLQTVPVIPVEQAGARYLVSTRGESEWVRNLRAAGGRGELRRGNHAEPFLATEVPLEHRSPVIARYQAKAGRAVTAYYWKKLPHPADHPVFRLEPRPA